MKEDRFMDWTKLLNPAILGILVPIVAIIAWAAVAMTKMIINHRERLARIERGRNPEPAEQ
jgi:hypothetical protein